MVCSYVYNTDTNIHIKAKKKQETETVYSSVIILKHKIPKEVEKADEVNKSNT